MAHIQTVLWVGAGGAIGAMARFLVGRLMLQAMGPGYPWGTLVVNVVGSLLMGVLVALFAFKMSPSQNLQAALTVGLLGGFTTFSAFSLETALMIERHEWMGAVSYALASVVLCVAGLFAGMALVRSLS